MKRDRLFSLLLAAALLISLCCTGCAKELEPVPASEEPTEEYAAVDANGLPVRWQNGGLLSFLPKKPLSIPKLSEMEYTRPDTEVLFAEYDALTEKVPGCSDAEALLNDYYVIAQHTMNFNTMWSLSYYLYCSDTSNSDYAAELDMCDEQCSVLDEKQGVLYAAFAASPCRDDLEKAYFGEGFFKDYDDFRQGGETCLALKQQENDLVFQYYDLTSTADYFSPSQIEKNHEAYGKIFIELVKVRQQIAEAKGYENYMDYNYACGFYRDYTTAQTREYLNMVKTMLAPLAQNSKIVNQSYSFDWDASKPIEMLSAAAEKMGGPVWDAFRFMSAYELYDVFSADYKASVGYTDYLYNYEAPILFVDPATSDLLYTLFHEFGHYCDFYSNCGVSGDIETCETYSQAMQYLAHAYAEPFLNSSRTMNLRATLKDLLVYSILQEGAFADFELQVYALAPEELTVDNLDAIFGQCIEDYGLAGLGGIRNQNNFWCVYKHFFARPGYVISYSDSAVASLQICRLEAEEPGAGVEAFCRLLNRTHGKKFAAVLAEAGLDSPFEEATLEKTAEFVKDVFGIN